MPENTVQEPSESTVEAFDKWLAGQVTLDGVLPFVRWENDHTTIAALFAEFYTRLIGNQTQGEALNSGDGFYEP